MFTSITRRQVGRRCLLDRDAVHRHAGVVDHDVQVAEFLLRGAADGGD